MIGTRCDWRGMVEEALRGLGGRASASAVCAALDGRAPATNKTWRSTVSRTLQHYFVRTGRGTYAIPTEQDFTKLGFKRRTAVIAPPECSLPNSEEEAEMLVLTVKSLSDQLIAVSPRSFAARLSVRGNIELRPVVDILISALTELKRHMEVKK